MKKLLTVFFICTLFVSVAFSQKEDYVNVGRFSKLIEYNRLFLGMGYNLNSKEDVEKRFYEEEYQYGQYNAPVEFLYIHPFDGYLGFRILMDSAKMSYVLKVNYVTNYKEAREDANKEYPTSLTPVSLIGLGRPYTEEEQNLLDRERREMEIKNRKLVNILYNIKGFSLVVSDQFKDKLYHKTVSFIDNFKAKGLPPHFHDGHEVIFRTVVDDELWSLKVYMPSYKILKMADIYGQIIEDVKNNKFDEAKYIKLLDDF